MANLNYLIYRDWWEFLSPMTDEQIGQAVRAICKVYNGTAPEEAEIDKLSDSDRRAMLMILAQVERSVHYYERKSKRAAEDGAGV